MRPYRLAFIGTLAIMLAMPAAAQTLRDTIADFRLGSGYALMLNLAATPDVSTGHYYVKGGETRPSINILRIPFESRLLSLSDDANLFWRIAGGFLPVKDDFAIEVSPDAVGSISSKWSAFSLTGGLLARIQLGNGVTLAPALDAGVAWLKNRARYAGVAAALQPSLDGLLFNWKTKAWLVTPNLGLAWTMTTPTRRTSVRGHVAWSWISSFDESDPVLKFDEKAGVYSIRAEHSAPTGMQLLERPLYWVPFGGYAGFIGADRDALGFTSVIELGVGVEAPLSPAEEGSIRVRLGASYLFGPDVEGWAAGLGLSR